MKATPEEIRLLHEALAEGSEDAWERAWPWWAPRVAAWVRRHPQFHLTGEEVSYFVDRVFERLWRVIDPQKLERFQSPDQLLQYLKLCVHSAILDELRPALPSLSQGAAASEELETITDPRPGIEATVVERVRRRELWAIVASHVQTSQESAVVKGSFVHGLPPREIAARYAGLFADVQDIYRIKRNLLERLSRDSRLKELL